MGLGAGILTNVLSALVVCVLGILTIRLLMALLKRTLASTKLEKAAHSLIISLARVALYVLLGLMVASALGIDITGIVALASVLTLASSLGIDITGIVALASVATLAVSLALQNMLANVIGGFTLLYTHPFGSGDYVEIAGQSGTVNEVGIAYTKLITPDNKLVFIPNSAVVSAEIVNYTVTGTRRVDIAISASYDVPVAKVEQVLMEAAQVPGILVDPAPFVSVTGYGDSAIQYVVRVWTKAETYWDVHFAITHSIKEKFDSNDVQMTYPHLNIHIDK